MSAFREGDVVSYAPGERFPGQRDTRWCREGTAIAGKHDGGIQLADTFWLMGTEDHILTEAEIATAELLFNLDDYDELGRYSRESPSQWKKYAPADRQQITSQHGLQHRWFIRKGAAEDHATQVENARERLREAEAKLQSAQWSVESAQRDLAEIESQVTV
jgi:hypothetical protein